MALKDFAAIILLMVGPLVTGVSHNRNARQLVTCPGLSGYCSEAYPGGVCTVVCAFGRPNVPECQPDGTWTDTPRCIEHEPGKEEQIPGQCPGIPGYCSDDYPGAVCEFDCLTGPDIRSFCTPDGTWDPYPVCDGDIRETRDGCDGCPGPFGGPRDRKAEVAGGGSKKSTSKQGSSSSQGSQKRRPTGATAPASGGNGRRPSVPKQQARPVSTTRNKGNGNSVRGNGNSNRGNGNRRNNNNKRNNNRRNNAARPPTQQQRPKSAPLQQQRPKARPIQQSRPANNNRNNGNNRRSQQKKQQSTRNQNKSPAATKSTSTCPGDVLEACINVCPSFSARIFGACVAGCARRCPSRK